MSISQRNSSNITFYQRNECRSSLLCHPAGLELLQTYVKKKKEGIIDGVDSQLINALANKLAPVVRESETSISSAIRDVVNAMWHQSQDGHSSCFGETDEAVSGTLEGDQTSGNPDGVVRLADHVESEKLKAQLILEVSVDNNGGEKKIGQAFDYASLMKDQSETALLFTFHVLRNKSKPNSDESSNLKITQEAFIYVHAAKEEERKMGFLWREVYEQEETENDLDFLKKSSEGIVRCLECAIVNRDADLIYSVCEKGTVVSDNVVISGGHVYKIFDNRFHPTHRRPDQWLSNQPWSKRLGVERKFEFQESTNSDKLGRPQKKKKKHWNDSEFVSHTTYPKGSILIIKYNCVKGTHFASQASHFQQIAARILEMHDQDIVHGDIRGFNMLHPDPEEETGIAESVLIDFDLSGKSGEDEYPPGYSKAVKDMIGDRSGKARGKLKKEDDWKDLGSVMACYSISMETTDKTEDKLLNAKWIEIWKAFRENGSAGVDLLRGFIQECGDVEIEILYSKRTEMEEVLCKGTGSPNKDLQGPRGSLTVSVDT